MDFLLMIMIRVKTQLRKGPFNCVTLKAHGTQITQKLLKVEKVMINSSHKLHPRKRNQLIACELG